jgi:hypothetical protein
MGHADHFLSRLDRLPRSQIDVALELYRDPDFVRFLLASVNVPEAAERVAISLDHPVDGPFVVVTRGGHFVTCLGAGMRPTGLPVVSRGQLDALAAKVDSLRSRIDLATRVTGNRERACAILLRKVLDAPDRVSREDFAAVSAWQPLLAPALMGTYLACGGQLAERAATLRALRGKKGPRVEEALHEHFCALHAAGHFALLATMGGERETLDELTGGEKEMQAAAFYPLTGTGVITFILKGSWAAGRLGKLLLPAYKRSLVTDGALFEVFDAMFGLVAMATRRRAVQAEVEKALRSAPSTWETPGAENLRTALGNDFDVLCTGAGEVFHWTEAELEETRDRLGRHLIDGIDEGIPEDIRRELIRTLPLMSWDDGVTTGKRFMVTLALVALMARGDAEQFYLPREIARGVHRPWEPAFTWAMLEPLMKVDAVGRKPVTRAPTPGRNDPCPCGSGRKWKKCCVG